MIRSIATFALVLSTTTLAFAQIAPPPGAVTHQGTKMTPHSTAKPKMMMKGKKPMMHGMKATPKPKS